MPGHNAFAVIEKKKINRARKWQRARKWTRTEDGTGSHID